VSGGVTINEAYPWGRSFDEYRRMFNLTEEDLAGRIVGCADGPAAFNAGMRRRGKRVISCDPLYAFTGGEIRDRIAVTATRLVAMARESGDRFVWDRIQSPEELGRVRMTAMEQFLADYDSGRAEGRYLDRSLPSLGFPDGSFDLAICSHFLFLYSPILSLNLHQQAIEAMCAVAEEVRIFPLLTFNSDPSPYVEPVMTALRSAGRIASIERVTYEFQKGGNEMLRIHPRRC